jgi:hypothetical protein
MFLDDKEKTARMKVLKSLMGKVDEMDSERLKGKKPIAAEVSVIKAKPIGSSLEDEMSKAGHEGVEEAEEKLFPEEEEKEEKMMAEGIGESEESKLSLEEKMMIKRLYEKFFA